MVISGQNILPRLKKPALWLAAAFALAVTGLAFYNVCAYELGHAYTADSPLYWAVGRGMLNGLTPYQDMYENKPVGIFLVSALSFRLTGDTLPGNCLTLLSVIVIALLPALCVYEHIKDGSGSGFPAAAAIFAALMTGLLTALYCEENAGAFQAETPGTMFSLLFIRSARKLDKTQTRRAAVIRTALSALYISCAVMMKEPFLVTAVTGALLFTDSFRSFLKSIVIPCFAGGAFTVGALAASGILKPYLSIYISGMIGSRVLKKSSPFVRALKAGRLTDSIALFSGGLLCLLLIMLLLAASRDIKKSRPAAVWNFFRLAAGIYLAAFCVALGGQYYNHHYIFAAPFYCALVTAGCERLSEADESRLLKAAAGVCCGVSAVSAAVCAAKTRDPYHALWYKSIKAKAEYTDALLDYCGAERYQYIGFNGEGELYGLTRHSPQGPVFAQDPDNFQTEDSWFCEKLIGQTESSSIIIFKAYTCPAAEERIREIIESDFTETPPAGWERVPPEDYACTVYFRKGAFGN